MKVVYVVDSINEITSKIDLLKSRFGNNIVYVVKGELESIFRTYGYTPNAVYSKNLPKVISMLLLPSNIEDIIVCYSSLKLTNGLLNEFIEKIGNRNKIVYIQPQYNSFERLCNSAYNVYVKSLFKVNDTMASPKLQFLPSGFVVDLLSSHFSNRLFDLEPSKSKSLYVEDKEINQTLKPKTKFNKFQLLPIIAALVITIGLILVLALTKLNYLIILLFVFLYVLDALLAIIQQCKLKFDSRFMK